MVATSTISNRRFKVYTIHAAGKSVDQRVVEAAIEFVAKQTQLPAKDSGFGFVTIHFGDSIWLLVDVWKEDILCHFLFRSDYSDPKNFVDGPSDGTSACVWELEVTKHERDAWVKHVMSRPSQPEFEEYLNDSLKISV